MCRSTSSHLLIRPHPPILTPHGGPTGPWSLQSTQFILRAALANPSAQRLLGVVPLSTPLGRFPLWVGSSFLTRWLAAPTQSIHTPSFVSSSFRPSPFVSGFFPLTSPSLSLSLLSLPPSLVSLFDPDKALFRFGDGGQFLLLLFLPLLTLRRSSPAALASDDPPTLLDRAR